MSSHSISCFPYKLDSVKLATKTISRNERYIRLIFASPGSYGNSKPDHGFYRRVSQFIDSLLIVALARAFLLMSTDSLTLQIVLGDHCKFSKMRRFFHCFYFLALFCIWVLVWSDRHRPTKFEPFWMTLLLYIRCHKFNAQSLDISSQSQSSLVWIICISWFIPVAGWLAGLFGILMMGISIIIDCSISCSVIELIIDLICLAIHCFIFPIFGTFCLWYTHALNTFAYYLCLRQKRLLSKSQIYTHHITASNQSITSYLTELNEYFNYLESINKQLNWICFLGVTLGTLVINVGLFGFIYTKQNEPYIKWLILVVTLLFAATIVPISVFVAAVGSSIDKFLNKMHRINRLNALTIRNRLKILLTLDRLYIKPIGIYIGESSRVEFYHLILIVAENASLFMLFVANLKAYI